jgi:hypothetical protein
MKDRITARGGQVATFEAFVQACEQEAFVLEAVGHHFLQDAWSTGHMWERWGSPDLIDFTDLPQSLLIAMTSGLIHGARGVLQGKLPGDVNDPLCAPGPLVRFVPGPIAAPVVGLGDLYLGQLLDHAGAAFPAQYFQLFSCAATSLRQVARAMDETPGPLDPSLIEVDDPTGNACFGQRATNAAMVDGIGLDFTTPGGAPVRIELDSSLATQLVASASAAIGGSPQNVNPILQGQYAFDLSRIVAHARLRGAAAPDATDLASGGLGALLGIDRNASYVEQPLAPYVDPPLPWPSSPSAANDAATRAVALARTFHAAHALDWCNRFRAGAPDGSDVDLLRAHVHVVQAAGTGSDDLATACLACETFATRHLRVGTDESNYDTSREPLCHFVADDPANAQYVFQPGSPSDDVGTLAATYCGCATTTTSCGSGLSGFSKSLTLGEHFQNQMFGDTDPSTTINETLSSDTGLSSGSVAVGSISLTAQDPDTHNDISPSSGLTNVGTAASMTDLIVLNAGDPALKGSVVTFSVNVNVTASLNVTGDHAFATWNVGSPITQHGVVSTIAGHSTGDPSGGTYTGVGSATLGFPQLFQFTVNVAASFDRDPSEPLPPPQFTGSANAHVTLKILGISNVRDLAGNPVSVSICSASGTHWGP